MQNRYFSGYFMRVWNLDFHMRKEYRLCSRRGWSGRYFVLRADIEACIMRRFKMCSTANIIRVNLSTRMKWVKYLACTWNDRYACRQTDNRTHYAYGRKKYGTEWYELKKRRRSFYGRIRSRVNGTLVLPMSNILFTSRTAIRLMERTPTLISQSAQR
jgi:hypothetical protein